MAFLAITYTKPNPITNVMKHHTGSTDRTAANCHKVDARANIKAKARVRVEIRVEVRGSINAVICCR